MHRTLSLLALCAVAAWAAGCGDSPAAPVPPATTVPPATLAPATLADLGASVVSPQAGRTINCRDNTHVSISLTNRAPSPVAVNHIRKLAGEGGGDACFASPALDYRPDVATVAAGATAVVMDRDLYVASSGCCPAGMRCRATCSFRERFLVVTGAGDVDAGGFEYAIKFDKGCEVCEEIGQFATAHCAGSAAQ